MKSEDTFDASALGMMKSTILYKLTRSAAAIESFYN
jgi:hypothetical protein